MNGQFPDDAVALGPPPQIQPVSLPGAPRRPRIISQPTAYAARPVLASPQSQQLADALQSLEQAAPANVRTPTALGSDLLADALRRYGIAHQAQPQGADVRSGGLYPNPVDPRGPLDSSLPTGRFFSPASLSGGGLP